MERIGRKEEIDRKKKEEEEIGGRWKKEEYGIGKKWIKEEEVERKEKKTKKQNIQIRKTETELKLIRKNDQARGTKTITTFNRKQNNRDEANKKEK